MAHFFSSTTVKALMRPSFSHTAGGRGTAVLRCAAHDQSPEEGGEAEGFLSSAGFGQHFLCVA